MGKILNIYNFLLILKYTFKLSIRRNFNDMTYLPNKIFNNLLSINDVHIYNIKKVYLLKNLNITQRYKIRLKIFVLNISDIYRFTKVLLISGLSCITGKRSTPGYVDNKNPFVKNVNCANL